MASSDLDNAGVKAVITLGVLAFVGIVAVVVAKIVQYCVNKYYTDDDGGHIDENTRELIRARLSVVQFKKREIRRAQSQRTLSIFTKWKDLMSSKKKDREEALKSQRPLGNGQVVITIDKVDERNGKENGALGSESRIVKENGTPRIPRFSFFTQGRKGSGGVKPHSETTRIPPFLKTNTVKPESPVPRGRPVSSKQRTLPNVIVTDGNVNSPAKLQVKSVHFEEDIADQAKAEDDRPVADSGTEMKDKVNVSESVSVKTAEELSLKSKIDSEKKSQEGKSSKVDESSVKKNVKLTNSLNTADTANNNVVKGNIDGANENAKNDNTFKVIENKESEKITTETALPIKSGEKT